MKRGIALIIVFLLLGAIVNVAVAWGFAAYSTRLSTHERLQTRGTNLPAVTVSLGRKTIDEGFYVSEANRSHNGWYSPSCTKRSYGWPCHSLISRVAGFVDHRGWVSGWDLPLAELIDRGFPTARLPIWIGASSEDRLPLRPVRSGFIINTLFYALLLWLLFAAPFAARRMIRRRRALRGLCEKCAYPIGTWGGSPVCTECGAAVSRNEPRARQNEPRA